MPATVAVLATLDTKADEARFLAERIRAAGARPLLVDLGVIGVPGAAADVPREVVAERGGVPLSALVLDPTRERAAPVMARGAAAMLLDLLDRGAVHAVIGVGGTQGTSSCTAVMRELPYGFPKVMVSTVASGDTSAFVGIKDITMMFSVSDLLGLNPITRKILANAAAAAVAMAGTEPMAKADARDRPLIGMTNLGVLTEGALHALRRLDALGFEAIVFHAVGAGGRAMEQMMKDGLIGAVFDYALGEIADELFHGLRAGGPERLTVAAALGLPQVLCPGGLEHIGLFVDPPHSVPERWRGHRHLFHSPVILAPRLQPAELEAVAQEIGRRLARTRGTACFMLPLASTSRYGKAGMPLHDPVGDRAFFAALRAALPPTIEVIERDLDAEDPAFVTESVDRLIAML